MCTNHTEPVQLERGFKLSRVPFRFCLEILLGSSWNTNTLFCIWREGVGERVAHMIN